MTKPLSLAALLLLLPAAPARAGDPAAGEALFRNCKACHSIIAPDGTAIQKGGRNGPNLYGVIGRRIASEPDFAYGEGLRAVGASGRSWDAASLAAYVADPSAWVQAQTGDPNARAKMNFALSSGGDDVAAYLQSVAP